MKSMKTRLGLVALGIVTISGFSLMIASSNINLKADLSNAVQSIENVIFLKDISSNVESGVILTNSGNFVKIDTRVGDKDKNIIIEGNGTLANNVDEYNSKGSHILGGEGNHINGSYDTIIGGEKNKISSGDYSTIGGGNHNIITGNYNVIAGGSGNKIIGGDYSSIPGGENNKINGSYSVALGVNNVVSGSYSVALGSGSKVIADRSFLWTDGNQEGELRANDVFAIISKSGMAINTATPHDFAKLTVSGSLIIEGGDELACSEDTKGTIVARGGGQVCLYSCDGSERNSLYKGVCPISGMVVSECGIVNKICNADGSFYSGSCENGKVIEGTGSYFVDKDDNVHRTCQSEDGNLTECSRAVSNTYGDCPNGEYECDLSLIDDDPSKLDNILVSGVDGPLGGRFQKNNSDDIVTAEILESSATIDGLPCKGKCKDGYKVTSGSNGYYCTERGCFSTTINSYEFPEANHNEVKQSLNRKTTTPWNNGWKKCYGKAFCNMSNYVFSGEDCTYICGEDPKIYSGYTYTATFQSGTYVTGTKVVNSGGLEYTCSVRLECLYDSIINLSGNETCVLDGCESTTYIGSISNHMYTLQAKSPNTSEQLSYISSGMSCSLPITCNSNSNWEIGLETCVNPSCTTGSMPSNLEGVILGSNTGSSAWTYTGGSPGACEWTCDTGAGYYYGPVGGDTYGCLRSSGEPRCGTADEGYFDELSEDSPGLCEDSYVENFMTNSWGWDWECSNGSSSVSCYAELTPVCCNGYPSDDSSYDVLHNSDLDSLNSNDKLFCDYVQTGSNNLNCWCSGGFGGGPLYTTCTKYGTFETCRAHGCNWDCTNIAQDSEVGFRCRTGYHLEGCDCVVGSRCSAGNKPENLEGVILGGEGEGEWDYTDNSNPGVCQWTCDYNNGYVHGITEINGVDYHGCFKDDDDEYCEDGDLPSNNGYSLEGVILGTNTGGSAWTYTDSPSPGVCEWTCDTGAGYYYGLVGGDTYGCLKSTGEPRCGFVNGEEYTEISGNNDDYGLCVVGNVVNFKNTGTGWTWNCEEGTRKVSCSAVNCNWKWDNGKYCEEKIPAGVWSGDICSCICPSGSHENEYHECDVCDNIDEKQNCEMGQSSFDAIGVWSDDTCSCLCPIGYHPDASNHCESDNICEEVDSFDFVLDSARIQALGLIYTNGIVDPEIFHSECDSIFEPRNPTVQSYDCVPEYTYPQFNVYCYCRYQVPCNAYQYDCYMYPWGVIKNGWSITAWKASVARRCESETRTCVNGTLNGHYTNPSCRLYSRR